MTISTTPTWLSKRSSSSVREMLPACFRCARSRRLQVRVHRHQDPSTLHATPHQALVRPWLSPVGWVLPQLPLISPRYRSLTRVIHWVNRCSWALQSQPRGWFQWAMSALWAANKWFNRHSEIMSSTAWSEMSFKTVWRAVLPAFLRGIINSKRCSRSLSSSCKAAPSAYRRDLASLKSVHPLFPIWTLFLESSCLSSRRWLYRIRWRQTNRYIHRRPPWFPNKCWITRIAIKRIWSMRLRPSWIAWQILWLNSSQRMSKSSNPSLWARSGPIRVNWTLKISPLSKKMKKKTRFHRTRSVLKMSYLVLT